MERQELLNKISKLTEEIGKLPKGYISKKTISGKTYFYHQWSENGKKQSRYLPDEEIEPITAQIEKRKELQNEIRRLRSLPNKIAAVSEATRMKCTLMHKRIPVAEIELDDVTGYIVKIGTVFAQEHLPIGIPIKKGICDRASMNEWWTDRSIPSSRSGVREALETLEIADTKMLLIRCNGLSLSDQYWIRPDGSELTWDTVNFFDNSFSDDIGDVLFGTNKKKDALDLSSPDNTSDGNLKKRWKVINGKRCLVKGGSNPFRQQPFNEQIATEIMKKLGIDCVPYQVVWNKGTPYSVCEDFVSSDTELVSAWRILQTKNKSNSTSVYQHFLDCCEGLGINGAVEFLDRMIVLDYIIANEDRHLNNFGVLRNAETLEWLGFAPIFDSGSSLGYDKLPVKMRSEDEYICKPFKKHHAQQLRLISSFAWIDFEKLGDIREIITGIMTADGASDYLDTTRVNMICEMTERRIRNLEQLAMLQTDIRHDSTNDDVTEDVAEDYSSKRYK